MPPQRLFSPFLKSICNPTPAPLRPPLSAQPQQPPISFNTEPPLRTAKPLLNAPALVRTERVTTTPPKPQHPTHRSVNYTPPQLSPTHRFAAAAMKTVRLPAGNASIHPQQVPPAPPSGRCPLDRTHHFTITPPEHSPHSFNHRASILRKSALPSPFRTRLFQDQPFHSPPSPNTTQTIPPTLGFSPLCHMSCNPQYNPSLKITEIDREG